MIYASSVYCSKQMNDTNNNTTMDNDTNISEGDWLTAIAPFCDASKTLMENSALTSICLKSPKPAAN